MSGISDNRGALVTGAGSGIGRAIALRLAADGLFVSIADINEENARNTAQAISETGGAAVAILCDVSSQKDVDRTVQKVIDTFGRLDVLVNNAGVATAGFMESVPDTEIERVLAVNLTGAIRVIRASVPFIKNSPAGRIINISSVEGIRGSGLLPIYSSSKAGLIGLTRANAVELAGNGITVNAVCPGAIQTEMLAPLLADEKFREKMIRGVPMKRLGVPDDVAGAVAFLASEEASYITGNVMVIDGGMTVKTL